MWGQVSHAYVTHHIWWLSPKETLEAENVVLFNYLCEELTDFKLPLCDFSPHTEMLQFNKFNKAISAKCFSYSGFASGTLIL